MADGQNDTKWQKFVESAFKAAGLPEVTADQLETGTYTNAEIAEKFRGNPIELLNLLMGVSNQGGPAEKRNILSLAVDMIKSGE